MRYVCVWLKNNDGTRLSRLWFASNCTDCYADSFLTKAIIPQTMVGHPPPPITIHCSLLTICLCPTLIGGFSLMMWLLLLVVCQTVWHGCLSNRRSIAVVKLLSMNELMSESFCHARTTRIPPQPTPTSPGDPIVDVCRTGSHNL